MGSVRIFCATSAIVSHCHRDGKRYAVPLPLHHSFCWHVPDSLSLIHTLRYPIRLSVSRVPTSSVNWVHHSTDVCHICEW